MSVTWPIRLIYIQKNQRVHDVERRSGMDLNGASPQCTEVRNQVGMDCLQLGRSVCFGALLGQQAAQPGYERQWNRLLGRRLARASGAAVGRPMTQPLPLGMTSRPELPGTLWGGAKSVGGRLCVPRSRLAKICLPVGPRHGAKSSLYVCQCASEHASLAPSRF